MNTRQLECFIRLSDNLSFTKTAEDMFMSQSTVTREIRSLEDELGVQLFKRSVKSVELTTTGHEFKDMITPAFNSLISAISTVQQSEKQKKTTLRIGFFHTASLKFIPEAIGIFYQRYPEIIPEIHQANLNNLKKMYKNSQLDIVFAVKTILDPNEYDVIKDVYHGEIVVTAPISSNLCQYDELTMDMLDGSDYLALNSNSTSAEFGDLFSSLFYKCHNLNVISCTSTDEQETYLRAGIGIAVSTDYSFKPSSKYKQMKLIDPAVEKIETNYSMMYNRANCDKHIDEFVEILDDLAKKYNFQN